MTDKLSVQHRIFVNEYIANGGNATKAYEAAGYAGKGGEISGHQLLRKPKIQAAVIIRQEEVVRASEITLEKKRVALWSVAEDGMKQRALGSEQETIREGMRDGRTSVAAISELNKMDGHHQINNSHVSFTSVTFNQGIADSTSESIDGECKKVEE